VLWDASIGEACDPKHVLNLKLQFQGAPLLVITTFPRQTDVERMLAAGVDAFIAKPFLLADLQAEIEGLLSISVL
jgi:CheY-like chemotaxis protein